VKCQFSSVQFSSVALLGLYRANELAVYYCPHGSDGLYRFCQSFFFVSTITHELLHLHVPPQPLEPYSISRSHGLLVFFCVRDTADTRGQYLALSKVHFSSFCELCEVSWVYFFCSVFTYRHQRHVECDVSGQASLMRYKRW